MNRLDELPRCEGCGATMPSPDFTVNLCADCRPAKPERPPTRAREGMERTRVMRAQGFTERQIADALGVTVQTIKARLKRARERGEATQKGAR